MKKNKVLSLFVVLTMVIVCMFSGVCEAVAVQGGSNVEQSQGASSGKLSDAKAQLSYAKSSIATKAKLGDAKVGSASKAKSIKSGNYMYYSTGDKIYKVNVKTKKSTLVYKGKSNEEFYDLIVKDGWIYCTKYVIGDEDELFTYVFRVKTDGKSAKVLKLGEQPVVYNGNIYYVKLRFDDKYGDFETLGIYKMSLSGKNDKLVKKASVVEGLIVYKSKIYYTTFGSSFDNFYLYSMPITGGKAKIMIRTNGYFITNLRAYSDYIYFNCDNTGENYNLYKVKINSTKKIKVESNAELDYISNGYIYYYTVKNGEKIDLYKINIKNKKKTKIKVNKEIFGVLGVEDGYMLLIIDNKPSLKYEAAVYLCDTNGKNGKVIKSLNVY